MSILRASSSATRSRFDVSVEVALALLLAAGMVTMQVLIGGGRFVYALPGYAIIALAGLLSVMLLGATRPLPDRLCFLGSVLFFGYVLARALFSPAPYLARTDVAAVLGGLCIYGLTSCYLTSGKTRMSILACLLAVALAHVLVGLIQFRNGNNFMPLHFLQRFDYGRRASGFYVCPDHLAGLLEVLGIFGLSIVCWSRWPVWGKLLIGYATAAAYFGVVISGSRGGYLSVIASVAVFTWLSVRLLRNAGDANLLMKIGAAGAIAVLLGIAAAVFVIRQSDSLRERTTTALAARDFRFAAWQAAWEQWKLRPLLGTGSRTYLFYGRKFRAERVQRDPVYAHNDYLQLLAEYGVIGLGACAVFLGIHLRRGLIDARRLGPKRIAISQRLSSNAMALNMGALSAAVAYAVHSIVDFNLHIPANVFMLAFVFGILANAGVSFEQTTRAATPADFASRGILVVIAISLGVLVWRVGPGEYLGERARVMLRDRHFLGAIAYAKRAIQSDMQNPELFYTLGRARTFGGDVQMDRTAALSYYEAARPAFERARESAPLDETYAIELALTYDQLGRFAEAEWMFGEAYLLDPRSTSLREYYRAHLARWKDPGRPATP
jgi:tetratricopeptide (TPR) repeat protein